MAAGTTLASGSRGTARLALNHVYAWWLAGSVDWLLGSAGLTALPTSGDSEEARERGRLATAAQGLAGHLQAWNRMLSRWGPHSHLLASPVPLPSALPRKYQSITPTEASTTRVSQSGARHMQSRAFLLEVLKIPSGSASSPSPWSPATWGASALGILRGDRAELETAWHLQGASAKHQQRPYLSGGRGQPQVAVMEGGC